MAGAIATTFTPHGTRYAAWFTRASGPGPHPVVVLTHGLGANHTMTLSRDERHFAAAGITTLAFDHRYLGASDGTPRQQLSLRRHRQDIASAQNYLLLQARSNIAEPVPAGGEHAQCSQRHRGRGRGPQHGRAQPDRDGTGVGQRGNLVRRDTALGAHHEHQ